MDDLIEIFSQKNSTVEDKLDALTDWLEEVKNELNEDGKSSKTSALSKFTCILRELVLSHRWQDVIHVLSQIVMEASGAQDVVHHLGFEVFLQESTLNYGLVKKFCDHIKLLSKYDTRQIMLDFFMYLLSQQHFESVSTAKHSTKTGPKPRTGTSDLSLKVTYRAYEGLLYYIKWCQMKAQVESRESDTLCSDTDQWFGQQSEERSFLADKEHLRQHKDRACTCFEMCLEHPGTWDVFIAKWVEMLEYHDEVDAARKVLGKYYRSHQENPYVLSLFYDFLKRHGDNGDKDYSCLGVLKALCEKVPFGECVLELYKQCGSEETPLRLKLLFTLLDYPQWKDNCQVWQLLAKELAEIHQRTSKPEEAVLSELWDMRRVWWLPYHFRHSASEETVLQCWKAATAVYLYGKDADYVKEIMQNHSIDDEEKQCIIKAMSDT